MKSDHLRGFPAILGIFELLVGIDSCIGNEDIKATTISLELFGKGFDRREVGKVEDPKLDGSGIVGLLLQL